MKSYFHINGHDTDEKFIFHVITFDMKFLIHFHLLRKFKNYAHLCKFKLY